MKKLKFKLPPWGKWALLVLLIVSLGFGAKSLYDSQQRNKRFDFMQKQRQVMIDALKEQGLSDEEIQQKMMESRPSRAPGEQPPEGFDMMRMGRQMDRYSH